MQFGQASIWILSLFWIIPAMILFYVYAFKKKARLIDLFCKRHLRGYIMPSHSMLRQRFKAILVLVAIIFMILALMRPRWGFHWEEIKRVGIDIIVAVDCSQSMMAEDVAPNRIERAKREIIDLLGHLDGDRIGLVAFAGTSFVQCPLTLDYGAFRMFLDYLDTELIPVQGTAIASAIYECIDSFDRTQKGSKAIILITDGEDHEGDPLEAAMEAKNRGVRIFTIGIGKEGGAPIPVRDGPGFKKDRQGNVILTKLDEKTLQRIALETGGSYVRSVTGDMDLEKIYLEGIKRMEQKELASTKKRIWEERFQWFLFLALIFLTLEQVLPERRTIRVKKGATGFLTLLFFTVLSVSIFYGQSPSWAEILPASKAKEAHKSYEAKEYEKALSGFLDAQIDSPEDPLLHYNIGNTYYRMSNYEEASKNYLAAANKAKDIEMEAKAYYNLGNCAYRSGKLEESINWYQKTLEIKPDDEEARHNLEFVRDEIKRRINEAKKQQDKQDKKEEDKKETGEKQEAQDGQKDQKDQGGQDSQGQQGGKEGEKDRTDAQQEQEGQQQQQGDQHGENDKGKDMKEEKGRTSAGGQEQEGADNDKEEGQGQGIEAKRLTPEEAQRLLDSLDEDRKNVSRKYYRQSPGGLAPEKDW